MSEPSLAREVEDHLAVIGALRDELDRIRAVGDRLIERLERGGKVLVMGNGGSAADSQHLAAELVGRFRRPRGGLAAVALTTDTSILTAVANDFGYEDLFTRQVEALCRPEDAVIGISTSGRSANVVDAIRAARARGAYTVGLTGGEGGSLRATAEDCVAVPSEDTARIQEGHILIAHLWCEMIDVRCAGRAGEASGARAARAPSTAGGGP